MSRAAIRAALETKLAEVSTGFATAWENAAFVPTSGVAYQRAHLLLAEPENPVLGGGFYRQRGILQVSLCYPLDKGSGDATARAEVIAAAFHRGLSVSANSVSTTVEKTPEIAPGRIEGDRFVIPVKVRFFANVS